MMFQSKLICFCHDASGNPYAVLFEDVPYYYITNAQGDVLQIVDASGNPVVNYTYDPYGKVLSVTGSMATPLGADNPLRYHGYVYDTESGFYYLQSRYYDSKICRFINADSYTSTGQGPLGYNMFAYCPANPINRTDAKGTYSVDCKEDDPNNNKDPFDDFGGGGGGGNGIKSGKLTFKSESALIEHYEQHNPQFGHAFKTPQEYVDAANYVIQNGEYVPNQNAYVKFYGMNGGANFAFVGVSHCHSYITTFHLKHVTRIQF